MLDLLAFGFPVWLAQSRSAPFVSVDLGLRLASPRQLRSVNLPEDQM
jgi:hypothetical protein